MRVPFSPHPLHLNSLPRNPYPSPTHPHLLFSAHPPSSSAPVFFSLRLLNMGFASPLWPGRGVCELFRLQALALSLVPSFTAFENRVCKQLPGG